MPFGQRFLGSKKERSLQFHQEQPHISLKVTPNFSLQQRNGEIEIYKTLRILKKCKFFFCPFLPEDGSKLEDSICCPLAPSVLSASMIFGEFLQRQKTKHPFHIVNDGY